jgi:hypothetical protein
LPAPTTTNNHPQASETTDILANRLNLKCYAHHVNIQILSTRPASYRGSTLRTIVVNRCVLRDLRQTVGLLVGTTYQVARTTANHHIEDSCRVRFSPKSTTTGVGYPDRGPSTPLPKWKFSNIHLHQLFSESYARSKGSDLRCVQSVSIEW